MSEDTKAYVAKCNRCGVSVRDHGSDHNYEPPPPRQTGPESAVQDDCEHCGFPKEVHDHGRPGVETTALMHAFEPRTKGHAWTMDRACSGCRGASVTHTCGKKPDAKDEEFVPLTGSATIPVVVSPSVRQGGLSEPTDRLEWTLERAQALSRGIGFALSGEVFIDAHHGDLRDRAHEWAVELESLICLLRSDCPERVEFPNDRD